MTSSAPPPPDAAIERSLRLSVIDGLFYAVMVGVCESYLGAFAVQLGHGATALALLVTVPMLLGAMSQLLAPALVMRLGNRRRVVVAAVVVQTLSLPVLLVLALRADTSFALLLLAKIVFWTSGSLAGSAWNAWMEGLTRGVDRARYFALRSMAVHVVLLVAFVAAGAYLRGQAQAGKALFGFAVLFFIASIARTCGAVTLALKVEGPLPVSALGPRQRLREAREQGRYRLPLFMGLFMAAAQISVPFFTPYMLRELRLDMLEFAYVIAASILAKAVMFPLWARAVPHIGMRGVFVVSVVVISFLPAAWTQITSMPALLVLQAVSGAVWAGWEYASLQLLMRDAPRKVGVEYFALTAALSGLLQLAGSLVGSALLAYTGDAYHAAFMLSSLGRMAALPLLIPWLPRLSDRRGWPPLFTRIMTVRPTQGAEHRPIVMSDPSAEDPTEPQAERNSSASSDREL